MIFYQKGRISNQSGGGFKNPSIRIVCMQSDLEIMREAKMEDISQIVWKLGISEDEIMIMESAKQLRLPGKHSKSRMTKPVPHSWLPSVNPTPFGEGKTVTTIGLTQALNRIGKRATCVIREPSRDQYLESKVLQVVDSPKYYQWKISTFILQEIYTP